ncbi:c-type cytochrome domain-containing protein [Chitinophaga sp. Ak27]|uniref:c-type cytochrome domain-containing protein n=1 Tax=Chitinophaga sp. Ak27 TaxID=2726116 RepID=UPI00145C5780|nr:c-type cytochrome domain-containing protein [Chitinophaga sp. Ak27]NLU90917.1 cytochrome C [Chitinophaga sp. Ak27]
MILKQRFRWQQVGSSLLFAANIFILFLLVFSSRLVLPPWLQVLGRMHPLLLHFPIVLIIIAGILTFIRLREPAAESWKQQLTAALLLAGALSAAVTVIMGLFLSTEDGYHGSGELQWHKWSGVTMLWLASALYWLGQSTIPRLLWQQAGAVMTILLLVITGHLGADITHGNNFVLGPVMPAGKPQVPFDQALVYEHLVKPVLEEKCMSCHNAGKAKGELAMELPQQLLKGGKSGKLFIAGKPELSLLMDRLHLPLDAKKHMPPAGKPQLTPEETTLLYYWIKSGADFKTKVATLPPQDSLRLLAAALLKPAAAAPEVYDFSAADEKLVQKLNNNYRVIYPIAVNAAPLVVNCYNKDQFNSKAIEELLPLKKQIIEMHLQKMPVHDEDLKTIARFEQLRVLNLSFTNVKGQTLSALASLPHLESLSLSGTPVTLAQLQVLKSATRLKELYLWNTALSPADLDRLQASFKQVAVIKGFVNDGSELLKLNQPQVGNTAMVFDQHMQLLLKHPIRGVEIRYTTDGSMPDSAHSPVFKDSLLLEGSTTIRVIACKKGWLASDPLQVSFYKSTYKPDSVILLTQPNSSYAASGAKTLSDGLKGGQDQGNGKWLGYTGNNLEAMLLFKQPVSVQSVSVGILRSINAYIFPPTKVEVWGGMDAQHMKLLKRIIPAAGQKDDPLTAMNIDCTFPHTTVSCVKLVLTPIDKLPLWHPGKGGHGWVFVDEILLN